MQDKLDSISYFFSNLKRGHEVEVGEWEMDLEGVRGGIMDKYDQNALYKILTELIKIFYTFNYTLSLEVS